MNGDFSIVPEGVKCAVTKLQGFINELLRRFVVFFPSQPAPKTFLLENAGYNFNVVLAEAIQAQAFARAINFSVGAHLGIAMFGGLGGKRPYGKPLRFFHYRREQQQIAALFNSACKRRPTWSRV